MIDNIEERSICLALSMCYYFRVIDEVNRIEFLNFIA